MIGSFAATVEKAIQNQSCRHHGPSGIEQSRTNSREKYHEKQIVLSRSTCARFLRPSVHCPYRRKTEKPQNSNARKCASKSAIKEGISKAIETLTHPHKLSQNAVSQPWFQRDKLCEGIVSSNPFL